MSKLFEAIDNLNELLNESNYYGVSCHSYARGLDAPLKSDGKIILFTSKEDASKARDDVDNAGPVNKFVGYTVFETDDADGCLVFNSFDDYVKHSETAIAKMAQDRKNEESERSTRRDQIAQMIFDAMKADSGINILGNKIFADDSEFLNYKHEDPKDVLIRNNSFFGIIIGAGKGHNGYSYGSINITVNKDLTLDCNEPFIYSKTTDEEAVAKVLRRVHSLIETSNKNLHEDEDLYAPTEEDWEDINHWYNDDPREEWDKLPTTMDIELSTVHLDGTDDINFEMNIDITDSSNNTLFSKNYIESKDMTYSKDLSNTELPWINDILEKLVNDYNIDRDHINVSESEESEMAITISTEEFIDKYIPSLKD